MEDWQRQWILRNTPALYELTEMKHLMLSHLQARGVLAQYDIDELKRVKHYMENGESVEKHMFFKILMQRDCYDELIQVLQDSCHGAAELLKTGRDTRDLDEFIKAQLDFEKKPDSFSELEPVGVHMEEWQKKWILITKAKELHQLTVLKPLMLINLQARGILDEADIDELERMKHHAKDGVSVEKSTFFTKLTGKNCYDILIKVFEEHGLTEAADVLRAGRDTRESARSKEELKKKEEPNPSNVGNEDIDKRIKSELNFTKERDPFTVKVRKPKDMKSLPESDYPTTIGGKRIFLLANFIDFDDNENISLSKRTGAGVDTRQLQKLWEGMDWEVVLVGSESREHPEGGYIKKEDLTKAIDNLKTRCLTEWIDALVVYISSHGSHDGFYTSDGLFIHIYNDVVYKFDNSERGCHAMEGKPKVFIQNTCAVFRYAEYSSNLEHKIQWNKKKSKRIDDAILVKVNIPGSPSHRHPTKGSQFAVTLILVLMHFASKLEFHDLMKKIDHYLGCIVASTDDPFVQRPQLESFGLKKFSLFQKKEATSPSKSKEIDESKVEVGPSKIRGSPPGKKFQRGPKDMQEFLRSRDRILLISTMSVDVTLEKIDSTLVSPSHIAEHEKYLQALIKDNPDAALFICVCGKLPDSPFCKEVLSLMSEGTKAILLTKDHNVDGVDSIPGLAISRDILRWSDLTLKFQRELLDRPVMLQDGGQYTILYEILKWTKATQKLQDEKLIVRLVMNMIPSLFRAIPPPLPYYVERTILSRVVLKADAIFTPATNDIFLFTGITRAHLSIYASSCKHSSDTSTRQVERAQLSANYIILEQFADFERICMLARGREGKKSKKVTSVHWIHYKNGKFLWVKSGNGGDMTRIQEARETMTDENEPLSEANFTAYLSERTLKYGNSPVVITGTPGMGKSTLLHSLGRRILAEGDGNRIVLLVALGDLVRLLKMKMEVSPNISEELFEDVLLHLTTECGPEVGKYVLKSMLHSSFRSPVEIKIELMLDGYDELSSEDLAVAKQIFALVQNTYNSSVRIWVTSRPHLLHDLENQLSVSGFAIQPFDLEDQANFLRTFWRAQSNETNFLSPDLSRDLGAFAEYSLKSMQPIWFKDNDLQNEDIWGIPLQCLLFAEMFEENCLHFVKRKNRTSDEQPILSPETCPLQNLCQLLVEKKLQIYTEKYVMQSPPEMKLRLINNHYFLAIQQLFPKYAEIFRKVLTDDSLHMRDILNVGIVESTNESENTSIRFTNRIVAEYLVARFIGEQMLEDLSEFEIKKKKAPIQSAHPPYSNYDLGNFLFDGVLETSEFEWEILDGKCFAFEKFEHQVLVYFLDSLLEDRPVSKSARLWDISAGRKCPVKACVHGDHLNLFQTLRRGYEEVDLTTLVTAVSRASTPFLQFICREYDVNLVEKRVGANFHKYTKCAFARPDMSATDHEIYYAPDNNSLANSRTGQFSTLLHFAVGSGAFAVVEYLLNCQGFRELVENFNPSIQDLIHALIFHTNKDPMRLITQKINILKLLVRLNKDLLKGTALVFKQSREGESSPPPFKNEGELKKDFDSRYGLTFDDIFEEFEYGDFHMRKNKVWVGDWETLDFLEDFYRNYYGIEMRRATTPLLQENVHPELILALLKLDGDPLAKLRDNSTLLHLLCCSLGARDFHRVVIQLGEDHLKELVNVRTKDRGSTVLHKIAESLLHPPAKETLEYFLKVNADFKALNSKGETCLHVAASVGNVEATRLFLELGSSSLVNRRNNKGQTPLERLLMKATSVNTGHEYVMEIGEMLISHGATPSKEWSTFVHKRLSKGEKSVLSPTSSVLEEEGAEVNAEGDNKGNTQLPKFFEDPIEDLNHLKLLLDGGADVNALNDTLMERWDENSRLHTKAFVMLFKKGAKVKPVEKAQSAFLLIIRNSDWLPFADFEEVADSLVSEEELRNEKGRAKTLLHDCAQRGSLNGVKYLLERGLNVNGAMDGNKTALHAALTTLNCEEIVKHLLEKGADVNVRDDRGATPLHQVATRRYASLVQIFAERGADMNARNYDGEAPLHAALCEHTFRNDPTRVESTLKVLIEYGADVKATNGQGYTILDLALHNRTGKWTSVVEYILETGEFDDVVQSEEFLLEKVGSVEGAAKLEKVFKRYSDVTNRKLQAVGENSADPEKRSLLHVALEVGNFELVKFLLDAELFADSLRSKSFGNLLHICVRNTNVLRNYSIPERRNIILKLVHYNEAFLNHEDAEGRTPLLVDEIEKSLLQALVELGADTNRVDKDGRKVAHLAEMYLKPEEYNLFATLLRRQGYSNKSARGRWLYENINELRERMGNCLAFMSWQRLDLPIFLILSTTLLYIYLSGQQ